MIHLRTRNLTGFALGPAMTVIGIHVGGACALYIVVVMPTLSDPWRPLLGAAPEKGKDLFWLEDSIHG